MLLHIGPRLHRRWAMQSSWFRCTLGTPLPCRHSGIRWYENFCLCGTSTDICMLSPSLHWSGVSATCEVLELEYDFSIHLYYLYDYSWLYIRSHLAVTRMIRAREFNAWINECKGRRRVAGGLAHAVIALTVLCLTYANLVFAAKFDRWGRFCYVTCTHVRCRKENANRPLGICLAVVGVDSCWLAWFRYVRGFSPSIIALNGGAMSQPNGNSILRTQRLVFTRQHGGDSTKSPRHGFSPLLSSWGKELPHV